MIINKCIDLFVACVGYLLGLLPHWDFRLDPAAGGAPLAGLGQMLAFFWGLDDLLPVSEVMNCISLALGLWTFMFSFKWIIKLLDWIDGIIP